MAAANPTLPSAIVLPTFFDRIMRALREIIWAETANIRFFGRYEYSVHASSGTLPGPVTIDATPTDPTIKLPPVTKCPVYPGLLGEGVDTVPQGTLVRVMFVNGVRSRPEIVGIGSVSADATVDATGTLKLGPSAGTVSVAGGGPAAARQADSVLVYFPPLMQLSGVVGTGPSALPFVGILSVPTPGIGSIQTGSAKTNIG